MFSALRVGVLIVGAAALGLVPVQGEKFGSPAFAAAKKCPPGKTPVEDIATGKIECEGGDTLDTMTLRPGRRASGAPASPGKPGKPRRPGKPKRPKKASSFGKKNCGLSRWGCEQACQQTYLSSATGTSSTASQRAKVALGSCLRICGAEFACEAKPPQSP